MKIRRLRFWDLSKIKKMVEYIHPKLSYRVSKKRFTLFPFDIIHGFLPLNFKFLQESFVGLEENILTGLIAIKPDGKHKKRWKINRFIFNSEDYEIGKYLLKYIINKFGAIGVETFLAIVDKDYDEAIHLFKEGCNFRECSEIYIKKLSNLTNLDIKNPVINLKKISYFNAKLLSDLDKECLYPHFRISLQKSKSDFKFGLINKLTNHLKGNKVKRLALKNPSNECIEGYVLITSSDNNDFWCDITLSLAYQEQYHDILKYIINYVQNINKNGSLYIYERKYYQSSQKLEETLNLLNFETVESFKVLVRDYWEPKQIKNGEKKSLFLFPDKTMPACNSISND